MWIPPEAEIAQAKLVEYLLAPRPWDDKSRFLARAGFVKGNWPYLERAIREMANQIEATEDGYNEFGVFWRIEGELMGPLGRSLRVVLIWMQRSSDGGIHLVTLKPWKKHAHEH